MFYPASIHTHTQFCDGKSTMAALARKAAAMRLLCLVFTPHSPLPYDNDWSVKESDWPAFFAECARLQTIYGDRLAVLRGVEWDSMTPSVPENLDLVIGAVHSLIKNGECFSVDYTEDLLRSVIARLYGGEPLELCKEFYAETARAALRPRVDVVAHLDLVTKYNKNGGILNENDPEYLRLARSCIDKILDARPDLFFEINTGVIVRAGKEYPYPAPPLLHYLVDQGARLVISCDCHRASQLCAGYDRARELLLECRHPRLYIHNGSGFVPYAL